MKCLKYLFLLLLFFSYCSVKAIPANDSFLDDNLYKCVIDAYNNTFNDNKDVSYSILPEELIKIRALDCSNSGKIENLSGLNRLSGLTNLNLSGNVFLGGSLKLTSTAGSLKSNISLPNNLTIVDKTYKIDDTKVVKIVNDKVYPLKSGSTYVTMTGKITGNTISEKYLVIVDGGTVKKSSNSKLSSLYLSKGEFSFDSDVKTYSTVVDQSISSVVLNATLSSKTAKFVSGYGPRTIKLDIGINPVEVKVEAEDGSTSTYIINIIRSDGNDRNDRLINIELTIGKIDFSPDVYNYNLSVESNVDEIDVKGVSESTLSKVYVRDINGNEKENKITSKLKVGSNKIVLKVVSESNSEKYYNLIINREDYDSLDNYLSSINITGYDLNFSKDKFNYLLSIKNEKELKITPVLEKSESSYEIIGNEDLKDNSKIIIKVSDKEGSAREYSIVVHKTSVIDNLLLKYIVIGFEFLLIIILLIVLLKKFSNRPRKPRKPKKVKQKIVKKQVVRPVGSSVTCKVCGTVNDSKSKTCYVCGNQL